VLNRQTAQTSKTKFPVFSEKTENFVFFSPNRDFRAKKCAKNGVLLGYMEG